MSDVQARPAASRGRGSGRGGRGGFTSRGGRNASRSAATNGDPKHDYESNALPTLEDQGEIGDLNKAFGSKVSLIKEVFPDWSEVDILYALKETDGDETSTIERIADGTISQWGEVSKPKDKKFKSKAKDSTFTTTTGADSPAVTNARTTRGGRTDGARGRGRATERGARSAARGRSSTATTNGRLKENQPLSVPTEDSNAWDATKNDNDGGWAAGAAAVAAESARDSNAAPAATSAPSPPAARPAAATEPAQSAVIPQGTAKTWASMLRQSTAPKPAPQPPKEVSAPVPEDEPEPVVEPLPAPDEPPAAAPEPAPEQIAELSAEPAQEQASTEKPMVVVPEVALTPSQDQLTETNLEQVVDESHPPVTETAASETADSWDPRVSTISANATPISASHAQHQAPKAPTSGFAATASRATERAPIPRTPSQTQRRFLNQEEAVRMPQAANQQLERATVQFGAFNLNGSEDDIDGDREEPETRAQPPADSPITQPRASLPPAPPAPVPEAFPTQKPPVALPPSTGPSGAPAPPTAPAAHQAPAVQAPVAQPPIQPAAQQQYGRFGQPTAQDQQSPFPQKPFDSYSQANPSAAQSQFEGFPSQQQSQPQNQQPGAAYSSSADQYSSFYTADQQNRNPYNYYGQNYGQQQTSQAPQDSGLAARAGFGGYGASQGDLASQYPQSANQSRFGTAVAQDPNSGNTTPNPTAQGQQSTAPSHPQGLAGQHQQQQQQQQQQHGNQFYNQPYYGQFYSNYMNQYGGYGQGGFPYGKAGGLYGQPHHYGMSQQQTPFEHGSSPATGYPQSSLHRNDSGGVGSGLGDYGRAGSAQSGAQPGLGGAGFGGIHDTFGRGGSYGAQAGQSFNAPTTQPAASSAEKLEPYGDAKTASGPSPSLVGARPGSATNTGPSQGGLPPPQSAQPSMGYGGYPSHLQGHGGLHGAQSAATGYGMGAGSGQAHQNSPYSAYGGFGGNSYYGSGGPRHGGWGSNYGGGNNF